MKVTISDVAKLAGVSTATVSHTINNTRYVSSETKEKVYRAISELGYTPDASARSFRTGKKKTVGFIVPDIANKFFATMIESVETCLAAHGYHLIIANTKEDMDREETNIRLLTAGLVDGLLIASTMDDFQRFDQLIPAGFPVVLVDRVFDSQKYSSVSVSNFQPIYRSVCRLAGKGDRRVGIIGGLPRLSSTSTFNAGFIVAILVVVFMVFITRKTVFGYESKMGGFNPSFARYGGTKQVKVMLITMALTGAIASMAGSAEVFGLKYRYADGMLSSTSYAWTGLQAALIAGLDPVGMFFVSIFLSGLQIGGSAIQRSLGIPLEIATIIQCCITLFVSVKVVIRFVKKPKAAKEGGKQA